MNVPIVIVAHSLDRDDWNPRCTCGWHGAFYSDQDPARDEGMVHSIAEGHQPAWEDKWKEEA